MALADLSRVKKRFIQILGANRLAYANTIGTGNAGIGSVRYDQELTDILLEADALVITEGYFQSLMSLRNRFLTVSANIANGDKLPEFVGIIGKSEYSIDGVTWYLSQDAVSKEDVINAARLGTGYTSAADFAGHHFFEEGYAFHSSPYFRVEYPNYTKTTALQSLEVHEPLVISGGLMLAYKDSSIHAADYYQNLFHSLLERVKQGNLRMKSSSPNALPVAMRG